MTARLADNKLALAYVSPRYSMSKQHELQLVRVMYSDNLPGHALACPFTASKQEDLSGYPYVGLFDRLIPIDDCNSLLDLALEWNVAVMNLACWVDPKLTEATMDTFSEFLVPITKSSNPSIVHFVLDSRHLP